MNYASRSAIYNIEICFTKKPYSNTIGLFLWRGNRDNTLSEIGNTPEKQALLNCTFTTLMTYYTTQHSEVFQSTRPSRTV